MSYVSVSQTVFRGCCGRESIAKVVSDTERMENKIIHARTKIAFVG
jgi:hypothetical protein